MTDRFAQYDVIPIAMRRSLRDYLVRGTDPGSFLTAVIANDLAEAVGRADRDNLAALKEIVMFMLNRTPGICHGNRITVHSWQRDPKLRADFVASPAGVEALAILDRRPGTAWMPDESLAVGTKEDDR